jgi:hypothetical protein
VSGLFALKGFGSLDITRYGDTLESGVHEALRSIFWRYGQRTLKAHYIVCLQPYSRRWAKEGLRRPLEHWVPIGFQGGRKHHHTRPRKDIGAVSSLSVCTIDKFLIAVVETRIAKSA